MANLKFADTHNTVAYLSKPAESDGFEQIVDFLNAQPIRYALTVNPTIYISCIEQFLVYCQALHKLSYGEDSWHATNEAVHKKLGDSLVRAVTTASSLEVEQDSGGGPVAKKTMGVIMPRTRFESVSKYSNDSLARQEDASKQGRINVIDADEKITLVGVQDDADKEIFDVDAFNGEEVFVAGQNENVVEEEVDAAQVM
ncbi:hypothetical protein Tco_0492198 [Tanacetum coccineum]